MRTSFDAPRPVPEGERQPKPEITFFFSAHGSPEDYKGIESTLQKADVFVVESHGWNEDEKRYLQEISNGKRIPTHITEQREPKDAVEYEEALLYQSGMQIEMVDIPEGHELADEDDGSEGISEAASMFMTQGDLESSLTAFDAAAKMNAAYIQKKDAYIERELRSLIDRLATENPDAKVLVQMGSTHTGISHNLRKGGDASVVRNEIKFDFKDELVRSYRFGKSPERNLVVKALAEQVLRMTCSDQLAQIPYVKRAEFFREQLADVTENQMRALGAAMESAYFDRVVMSGEADSPQLQQQILNDAWSGVWGVDINEQISRVMERQGIE